MLEEDTLEVFSNYLVDRSSKRCKAVQRGLAEDTLMRLYYRQSGEAILLSKEVKV